MQWFSEKKTTGFWEDCLGFTYHVLVLFPAISITEACRLLCEKYVPGVTMSLFKYISLIGAFVPSYHWLVPSFLSLFFPFSKLEKSFICKYASYLYIYASYLCYLCFIFNIPCASVYSGILKLTGIQIKCSFKKCWNVLLLLTSLKINMLMQNLDN